MSTEFLKTALGRCGCRASSSISLEEPTPAALY